VRRVAALRDTPLWWLKALVAASVVSFVVIWLARPYVGGDTPFVLDGTNAFLGCLSAHDFVACRHSDHLDYWGLTSPIGDWPLLQHIPDIVVVEVGANGHHTREIVLVVLGVAAIVGALVLTRVVLRRFEQTAWFWGFVAVFLTSPLIAYVGSTAGEALSAGLLVCLVGAALLPAPPVLLALAALAACVTKETSYPFVIALVLLGLLLMKRRTGRGIGRHAAWAAAGVGGAIVLASLFNVVRFGSVLNTNYLEPDLHTPSIARVLDYVAALFASPSGGMLVFWPSASVLLAAACLLPLVRSDLELLPALVMIGTIVGLTLGFAAWWTPFGWAGYGPRFTLPWVLPLVLLALAAYGDALAAAARRALAPTWGLLAVFAFLFAFSIPHVGQTWDQQAKAKFFADLRPQCDAPWRIGVGRFHACQHHAMWLSRPMPLYTATPTASAGGAALSIALGVGLLGSLVLLRNDLGAGRRRSSDPAVAAWSPARASAR
jgi:hypothetical protein